MLIDDDRPAWLVWKQGPREPYAMVYIGFLPDSHDNRRGFISEPRPLIGKDRELSLDALADKYPAPKGSENEV